MLFGRLKDVFQTLRFRLMLWVTLVVLVITLVTMLTVQQFVRNTLLNDFDQRLRDDIGEVASSIRQNKPGEDRLYKILETKARNHSLRGWFVQLYDSDHRLIWATNNAPAIQHPLVNTDRIMAFDEESLRLVQARFEPPGQSAVIIRLGSTRESVREDIDLLNRIMLLAGASILILAPVVGYLLAGRATRPLAWIISTTARLEPKNLDERLPVRGSGDELDQLSQTINGMLDRIATYLQSNRDFIANAAHELRSPLAAIRSSVEVALDRLRTPDEYAALLIDVVDETTRLGSLVNRLLVLAEGDAGRLEVTDQCVRLDKIVVESVDMFEAVAESVGVALKIVRLEPALVPGDDDHIRQVIRNLLDNAIKFTPATGQVLVSLESDAQRQQATLVIRDTGIGIPTEDLPRIFERFYRVDKSRQSRNSNGLGLAICHAIITALGGSIGVDSTLGQGSTFTITLPMPRPVQGESGSTAAA
jgi:heavy metal sensor kinase